MSHSAPGSEGHGASGVHPELALGAPEVALLRRQHHVRLLEFVEIRRAALVDLPSGAIFLFGFGTLVFLITALSDALSVLMVAILFYLYEKKSRWQYVILVLSIFQREHILLMFGLFTFIKLVAHKDQRRYNLYLLLASVAAFAGYIVIRKMYFSTPRYEHQMDVTAIFHMMQNSISDAGAYLRQSFLLQNLLFLYVIIYVYKVIRKIPVNRLNMIITLSLLVQAVLISIALGLGNNTGRYFYMCMPIVIYYIAGEAMVFFENRKPAQAAA